MRSRCLGCVGPRLQGVQVGVEPLLGHEFLVCAHLTHALPVEDHDQVSHAHGGEAMADKQGKPTVLTYLPCGSSKALEQGVLGARVEGGGGLVEYEEQGTLPQA